MEREKLLTLIGSICLTLVLCALPFMAACAPEEVAPTPTEEEPIELACANAAPAGFWNSWYQPEFARAIEAATDYRVRTRFYGGATLLDAAHQYSGTVAGVCDIAEALFAYNPGRFPLMATLEQPGIPYKNPRVAAYVAKDVFDKFKPAELSDVKVLWLYSTGPGVIASRKPINTLEDLKGLNMRCPGGVAPVVKALGANPVPMSQGETYIALQKGIVDSTLVAPADIKDMHYYELVDYVTTQPLGIGNIVVAMIMNLEKWNSLPPDIQDAISKTAEEYAEISIGVWQDHQIKALDDLKLVGMKISYLPPGEGARWMDAVKDVRDQYIAELEAKGLPGKEVFDYILERTQYWNEKLS